MKVVFGRAAERALNRIPADRQRQILARLKQVAVDPGSRIGDVRPLIGSDLLRLRVGDYRVLFSIDLREDALLVEAVGTRGDIYKR